LKGRLDEPGVVLERRLIEGGVVLEHRSREGNLVLEGCLAEPGVHEGRPGERGEVLEGHQTELGDPVEGRVTEIGVALEDRPGEVGVALEDDSEEPSVVLEGRPAELRVFQDWASVLVVGSGGEKALQQVLSDRYATCIQPAVLAELSERRFQVRVVGVRPAPAARREADADAALGRAGPPGNSRICHVALMVVAGAVRARTGGAAQTSSVVRSHSGRAPCSVRPRGVTGRLAAAQLRPGAPPDRYPIIQMVQSTEQWGGPTPRAGGQLLDGRTWHQHPTTRGQGRPGAGAGR
jgi:hypothetical protein